VYARRKQRVKICKRAGAMSLQTSGVAFLYSKTINLKKSFVIKCHEKELQYFVLRATSKTSFTRQYFPACIELEIN
jgi:hypothetical protein